MRKNCKLVTALQGRTLINLPSPLRGHHCGDFPIFMLYAVRPGSLAFQPDAVDKNVC